MHTNLRLFQWFGHDARPAEVVEFILSATLFPFLHRQRARVRHQKIQVPEGDLNPATIRKGYGSCFRCDELCLVFQLT